MSVINKMLRDLDARRAGTAVPGREAAAGLTRDTASVKGRQAGPQMLRGLLLAAVLVLGGAAAWWYIDQPVPSSAPPPSPARWPQVSGVTAPLPQQPASAAPAQPMAAAAPLGGPQLNQMLDQAARSAPGGSAAAGLVPPPAAAASAAGVSPEQAQQMVQQVLRNTPGGQLPLPQSPGLAYELQQQLAKPAASSPPAPPAPPSASGALGVPGRSGAAVASAVPPAPRATPAPPRAPLAGSSLAVPPSDAPRPLRPEPRSTAALAPLAPELDAAAKASSPATRPAPASRSARVAEPAPPTVNPRQTAALETLAQARGLWNAGSREAALDVMRQAVAVAERAQTTAPDATGLPAFQTLVRELARMELTQGQASQVLELLVRLEPLLADQADLWAVRGNAAQRLGRHADSVQAYQMALKLRPGEPRWLLASAVSLAALGQVSAAAEQAEQARAAGAVSQEVLTYLKQMGVPLR